MVCGTSGIPHRPRRVHALLREAARQSGDRRAMRAVDLEGHEVVAPHAHAQDELMCAMTPPSSWKVA